VLDLSRPTAFDGGGDSEAKGVMLGLQGEKEGHARGRKCRDERTGQGVAKFIRPPPDVIDPVYAGKMLVDQERRTGGPEGDGFSPEKELGGILAAIGAGFDLQPVVGIEKDEVAGWRALGEGLEPFVAFAGGIRDDGGEIFGVGEDIGLFNQPNVTPGILPQGRAEGVEQDGVESLPAVRLVQITGGLPVGAAVVTRQHPGDEDAKAAG